MSAKQETFKIDEKAISKEGFLEKQSRHFKRWKKRWFVLHDSTLYSFKKEKVYSDPTEIIDLRVFSSVKSSEDYTNRPHSFDVYSADMVFSMVATSENEKEDWIRAIGRSIVISRTKSWQDDAEDEDGTKKQKIIQQPPYHTTPHHTTQRSNHIQHTTATERPNHNIHNQIRSPTRSCHITSHHTIMCKHEVEHHFDRIGVTAALQLSLLSSFVVVFDVIVFIPG